MSGVQFLSWRWEKEQRSWARRADFLCRLWQ